MVTLAITYTLSSLIYITDSNETIFDIKVLLCTDSYLSIDVVVTSDSFIGLVYQR